MERSALLIFVLAMGCIVYASARTSKDSNEGENMRYHPRQLAKSSSGSEEDSDELEDVVIEEVDLSPKNDISERCIKNSVTPVSCPEIVPEDNLLPHPDDCHLFYYCVTSYNPPICRECPPNLHFNPIKKVCDFPETAGCQTFVDGPTARIAEARPSSNDSVVQCRDLNGVWADLRPHPTDCNAYYVCDWGTAILMYCPSVLHFNPTLKVCDAPLSAGCKAAQEVAP